VLVEALLLPDREEGVGVGTEDVFVSRAEDLGKEVTVMDEDADVEEDEEDDEEDDDRFVVRLLASVFEDCPRRSLGFLSMGNQ